MISNYGSYILMSLVLVISLISGYTDIRYRKILNWLTIPAMVLGLILQLSFYGWPGLIDAGWGFLMGFGFFFLFYLFGGMGAGDVKLMGALGILLGKAYIIYVLVFTGLFGLIIVLILFFPYLFLAIKTRKASVFLAFRKHYMPYGIAIALASLLTVFLRWMHQLQPLFQTS